MRSPVCTRGIGLFGLGGLGFLLEETEGRPEAHVAND